MKANCFAPGTQQNDLVSARPGVQCTYYKAPASPSKQKPIKEEVFIYFNIIYKLPPFLSMNKGGLKKLWCCVSGRV